MVFLYSIYTKYLACLEAPRLRLVLNSQPLSEMLPLYCIRLGSTFTHKMFISVFHYWLIINLTFKGGLRYLLLFGYMNIYWNLVTLRIARPLRRSVLRPGG
jgi:hypothetical protein